MNSGHPSSSHSDATTDSQSTASPAGRDDSGANETPQPSPSFDSGGFDSVNYNPNIPHTDNGSPESVEGTPSSDEYSDEGVSFDTTPVAPSAQNQTALATTGMEVHSGEEAGSKVEESEEGNAEEDDDEFLMSGALGYRERDEEYRPLLREQESASPVYLPEGAGRGMVHDDPDDDEGVSFGTAKDGGGFNFIGSIEDDRIDDDEAGSLRSLNSPCEGISSLRRLEQAAQGETFDDDRPMKFAQPASPRTASSDEANDDEVVSFGPGSTTLLSPEPLQHTESGSTVDCQPSDDDEALSFGPPPTPRPPPIYLRRIAEGGTACQLRLNPRPATVFLNNVLHGEGREAQFASEPTPEPPLSRGLDLMDIDDEHELPPEFPLPPPMRIPPGRTAGAFVQDMNVPRHAEDSCTQDHDSDEDAKENLMMRCSAARRQYLV